MFSSWILFTKLYAENDFLLSWNINMVCLSFSSPFSTCKMQYEIEIIYWHDSVECDVK